MAMPKNPNINRQFICWLGPEHRAKLRALANAQYDGNLSQTVRSLIENLPPHHTTHQQLHQLQQPAVNG